MNNQEKETVQSVLGLQDAINRLDNAESELTTCKLVLATLAAYATAKAKPHPTEYDDAFKVMMELRLCEGQVPAIADVKQHCIGYAIISGLVSVQLCTSGKSFSGCFNCYSNANIALHKVGYERVKSALKTLMWA